MLQIYFNLKTIRSNIEIICWCMIFQILGVNKPQELYAHYSYSRVTEISPIE